jgi:hypothetical protein
MELYLHSPSTPSWCGTQLKKKRKIGFVDILKHVDPVLGCYIESCHKNILIHISPNKAYFT